MSESPSLEIEVFNWQNNKHRFLPKYYTVVVFFSFLFEGKGVISCCKGEKRQTIRQQQRQ